MRISTIALAATLAATSSFFAQAGSGSGATVPEKSDTAVNGGSAAVGTTNNGMNAPTTGRSTTTGTSRPSPGDASNQGAGTAGSAEKQGDATSPGGTMKK